MASSRDYIPAGDAAFDAWFTNLVEYVLARVMTAQPVWTHIPVAEAEALAAAHTAWHEAYVPVLGAHTPVETLAKNEARKAALKVIRLFVNRYLRFPPVTDEDRAAMGIPNPHPRREQIPAPATVPELSPRAGNPRQVIVDYRDAGAVRRGKPADTHGIEVRWALLDHPPADVEDLHNSAFDTRSPLTLDFEEHDRGKRLYMAGCWEIEREGIKGKYGEIVSAVVP